MVRGTQGARCWVGLLGLAAVVLGGCVTGQRDHDKASAYERIDSGIVVSPAGGPAKRVRLQVMSDRIVRVTAAPQETLPGETLNVPASLMVTATPSNDVEFTVEERDGFVVLKTARVQAEVSTESGAVRFLDDQGRPILAEHERAIAPVQVEGRDYYAIRQQFNRGTDEAFYGLGQHQNAQMNLNGEDVELAQHNMDVGIPFVVSDRNYGVLWDNNSITRFGNPRPYGLASRDLKIYDASGKPGGFTASYYAGDELKVRRIEKDINYQYIKDLANRPEEMLGTNVSNTSAQRVDIANARVVWEGKLESAITGTHKFQLYSSSYFKLLVNGQVKLDGWRQNWLPWYHNFEVDMTAGQPVDIRIEWVSNDGHIALLHNDPMPRLDRHSLSLASEVAHAIDYYYVAGSDLDEVIAGYRHLTGKAVLFPKWAYGFWQSRQRYTNQQELVDVVKEYRARKIPLDNIVLDWFYWPEDAWGSHEFDATRFPNPKAMLDEVHRLDANLMISVWPKFYPTTQHYQELDAKGHIYRRNVEMGTKDWVGSGYLNSFYDPYSKEARDIYWRQVDEKLNALGIDAWWLDATEPDIHSNLDVEEIKRRISPTALGPGAAFFNSYPLVHSEGVYAGARQANPDERVFILTRSSFGGQQRTAAATWSGDVASRWVDLYNQISAGVNFSLSGLPNWTFDIGGFSLESRFAKPNEKDLEEWRELNVRWFQFGAFAPLFRSHGEFPYREIFNLAPEGSEVYETLVWYDELRYRLLPYIYTVAADTYHKDSIIMRGLVMDFAHDAKVRDIKDQYLFGPAFLVNPVYAHRARSRGVYLPAGVRWYDFYTGEAYEGGKQLQARAPLTRMPLFVKAGSIVPMGPVIQHTGETPDAPLTLHVYTGADGRFELYEDDGRSYGYERGEFVRIPFAYDDASGTLTIGARQGSYPGMTATRQINVRWITSGVSSSDFAAKPDATVQYSGAALTVRR
jgi:alpha-D-xyloside xylohydrolase